MGKRRGNFKIAKDIIEKGPELVKLVMGHCIIYRAEYMWESNAIEYSAESDLFEPINEGEAVPDYEIMVTSCGNVSAKKR